MPSAIPHNAASFSAITMVRRGRSSGSLDALSRAAATPETGGYWNQFVVSGGVRVAAKINRPMYEIAGQLRCM